jgi:hypothetical protein
LSRELLAQILRPQDGNAEEKQCHDRAVAAAVADFTGVAARFDQPGLRGARARLLGPYLGGIPLAELAPGDVQAMFTAIIRNQGAFGHRSSRYGGPLAWSDGG